MKADFYQKIRYKNIDCLAYFYLIGIVIQTIIKN